MVRTLRCKCGPGAGSIVESADRRAASRESQSLRCPHLSADDSSSEHSCVRCFRGRMPTRSTSIGTFARSCQITAFSVTAPMRRSARRACVSTPPKERGKTSTARSPSCPESPPRASCSRASVPRTRTTACRPRTKATRSPHATSRCSSVGSHRVPSTRRTGRTRHRSAPPYRRSRRKTGRVERSITFSSRVSSARSSLRVPRRIARPSPAVPHST